MYIYMYVYIRASIDRLKLIWLKEEAVCQVNRQQRSWAWLNLIAILPNRITQQWRVKMFP
jgi:hypothetical protein